VQVAVSLRDDAGCIPFGLEEVASAHPEVARPIPASPDDTELLRTLQLARFEHVANGQNGRRRKG
jgi:hypothetical protein